MAKYTSDLQEILELEIKVEEYLPKGLQEFAQYKTISNALNHTLKRLSRNLQTISKNQDFKTMDITMIEMYEYIFGITPNPSIEDLDFRRSRLINRNSMKPPFTESFLRKKLDEIIGGGRYLLTVNGGDNPRNELVWNYKLGTTFKLGMSPFGSNYDDNYTIVLESGVENQNVYAEVSAMINLIKPANMVFINKPLITDIIEFGEEVFISDNQWNYKLGTSFVLGAKPFKSSYNDRLLKRKEVESMTEQMLIDDAWSRVGNIKSVRINNSLIIPTGDITRSVEGTTGKISYSVSVSDVALINKIELFNGSNALLSTINLPIPVVDSINLVHRFVSKDIAK